MNKNEITEKLFSLSKKVAAIYGVAHEATKSLENKNMVQRKYDRINQIIREFSTELGG